MQHSNIQNNPISATFNDRVKELQRLQKVRPTPRTNRSFSRASLATLREHRFSRSALFINIPTQGHAGGMSGNNLNTLVVSFSIHFSFWHHVAGILLKQVICN